MKKRISVFLISILLCLACAFPVWAGTVSRLDDQAGLLDAEQQESLSSTLDEISERDQVDVVVVTVNSLEGKTAQAYAEDYFIDHGYGQGENGDGILFHCNTRICDRSVYGCRTVLHHGSGEALFK